MRESKYWILMKMFLYLIKFGIFHAVTCNIIVIKSIIYTTRLADLVRTRAQNNLDNCSWPWCEHYRGLDTALMVILFAYHASSLSGSHLGVLWDVFTVSWELGRVTMLMVCMIREAQNPDWNVNNAIGQCEIWPIIPRMATEKEFPIQKINFWTILPERPRLDIRQCSAEINDS